MRIHILLTEAMRSFTREELHRFDKFLLSPYFVKKHLNKKKVYELFKILESYFQQYKKKKGPSSQQLPLINWVIVSNKLFQSLDLQELKQKRLNKLCSELISCILDFFAVENFINKKVEVRTSLSYDILERNLSNLFDHCWKVKYFNGIYSEDEVTSVYHRYQIIRISNLHKEKCKDLIPDYSLELFLLKRYYEESVSEIYERGKQTGYL